MRRIFCFGDSITFGERDTRCGGWVSRLNQRLYSDTGPNYLLKTAAYNLGIGGETTDGLKQRFEQELLARYHKGMASTVLFQYGLNDMVIHKNKNRVPLNYFKRNLQVCLDKAQSLGVEIGLIGILPFCETLDGKENCYGHLRFSRDVALYNDCLMELAEVYGAAFIDVSSEFDATSMLMEDGIHPNADGHEIIEHSIYRWLEEFN